MIKYKSYNSGSNELIVNVTLQQYLEYLTEHVLKAFGQDDRISPKRVIGEVRRRELLQWYSSTASSENSCSGTAVQQAANKSKTTTTLTTRCDVNEISYDTRLHL